MWRGNWGGIFCPFMQMYLKWDPSTWALASGCLPLFQSPLPLCIAVQITDCYWLGESFLSLIWFSPKIHVIETNRKAQTQLFNSWTIEAMDIGPQDRNWFRFEYFIDDLKGLASMYVWCMGSVGTLCSNSAHWTKLKLLLDFTFWKNGTFFSHFSWLWNRYTYQCSI